MYIEYEDGGDLWHTNPPQAANAPEIAKQLLKVLVYLHRQKVSGVKLHRTTLDPQPPSPSPTHHAGYPPRNIPSEHRVEKR
jgi:hypothetical protein